MDLQVNSQNQQKEDIKSLSQDISNLLHEHKQQLLAYDVGSQSIDSLLDLVLAAEFLSFCYQTKSEVPPIVEPLLEKMDRLTLNQ
jgi:hypothetical protein